LRRADGRACNAAGRGAGGDYRCGEGLFAPDWIGKDEFITPVLEATDNPRIIAALAVHGHPVAGN
jgi:hypothetical protein